MKKFLKSIMAFGGMAALAIGFAGCSFSAFRDNDAKSAYQLACENGFSGTEEEWLESLRGKDGENLTVSDVYSAWLANGNSGDFNDFLREYLSLSVSANNDVSTISKNLMSVVSVYSAFDTTRGWIFGSSQMKVAAGSGVIWQLDKEAGDAYVITNYHVVYEASTSSKFADSVYLYLYGGLNRYDKTSGKDAGGDGIPATIIGGSSKYDIALLKVENSTVLKGSEAIAATIGDSDTVTVGEKVFAIGNAQGEGISVTQGVLSVDSETIALQSSLDESKAESYRVMRTDAAINHGNSGGALFNAYGQLIGITNAKNAEDEVDNMGYALPITQVEYVLENLLANDGTLTRALLGITVTATGSKAVLDGETGKAVIVEDISVASVESKSAAYGVLKKGDILRSVTIGGKTTYFTRQYQVIDRMLSVRKGDTVKMTVIRSGVEKEENILFDKDAYFTIEK